MGFFQDLKQDLSQAVNDLGADESLNDLAVTEEELEFGMNESSEDLFGSVESGNFTDLEAMLEKEVEALGNTVEEKNNESDIFASLEGYIPTETVQETTNAEELKFEESTVDNTVSLDNDTNIEVENSLPSIDDVSLNMDLSTKEEIVEIENSAENDIENIVMNDDAEITVESETDAEVTVESETDAEMERLLNEVEQNIEEHTYMETTSMVQSMDNSYESDVAASTDTAVITEGMNILGDISSTGNMDLIGTITGNIEIQGKLNVTGSINGNSSASEIYAESAQINGEVKSKGSVKIGQSSVVIGNIYASSAVIAGAVKGDIDVHGPVILDTSAIVMGNIKSKSVQINNGAVIEGMCSQCYAEVSPTSFFNDVKKNRK